VSATLLDHYDWGSFERVVVLSPHLDDAALSCGGLLARLRGVVSRLVVTISCSQPTARPSVNKARARNRRGFAPPSERRREDTAAMQAIDCDFVHLGFADAIYRRSPTSGALIYRRDRGHITSPPIDDAGHVEELFVVLRRMVCDMGRLLLVSPLGVGHHVDHLICAQLALRLASKQRSLLFYEDFPYIVRDTVLDGRRDEPRRAFERLGCQPGRRLAVPYDLEDKMRLLMHYGSQVPILFGSEELMRGALEQAGRAGAPGGERPAEYYWTAPARRRPVTAAAEASPSGGESRERSDT
jgi:LmbE family N-acetylglucosaminyl deacetylase